MPENPILVIIDTNNDAKFISCAIASKADYFITGDRDFSEVNDLTHTKILSVAKFAKLMDIN